MNQAERMQVVVHPRGLGYAGQRGPPSLTPSGCYSALAENGLLCSKKAMARPELGL